MGARKERFKLKSGRLKQYNRFFQSRYGTAKGAPKEEKVK